MMQNTSKVALIVGAGDGTGGAVARKFAREGFTVCAVRRKLNSLDSLVSQIQADGGKCIPFGCDARDENQVTALVHQIETEIGQIDFACYNIGANVNFPILETTSRVYRKVWEMGCFSGFLVGREVARSMLPRGHGTIIFSGATASVRGGPGYAAFAGSKHGLRALAQSMARELGPRGIHVCHSVIDGMIDTKFIQGMLGEDTFPQFKEQDRILNPDHIAMEYFHLHNQPRSCWTFELDMRPWSEKF